MLEFRQKLQTPLWMLLLEAFRSYSRVYFEREFAQWEQRIREPHDSELDQIDKAYEEEKSKLEPRIIEAGYDLDDIYSDRYFEELILANKMYAALIVALWSYMESSLSTLANISQSSTGRDNSRAERRFDRLMALFGEIFSKDISSCCTSYGVMNSTRLLCNAFKHNEGKCDSNNYDKLDENVKRMANIQPNKEIDYKELDIQALVNGCRDSIDWIVQEIDNCASQNG